MPFSCVSVSFSRSSALNRWSPSTGSNSTEACLLEIARSPTWNIPSPIPSPLVPPGISPSESAKYGARFDKSENEPLNKASVFQSSWNHAPVFATANSHITKVFSVIRKLNSIGAVNVPPEKLPCAEVSFVSANRINVASEVNMPLSTRNAPRQSTAGCVPPATVPGPTMVSCMFAGTVIVANPAAPPDSVACSVCPFRSNVTFRTPFGGVIVTLSVTSASNVTVVFFNVVRPIASCTLA